jgi:hypothetical protein
MVLRSIFGVRIVRGSFFVELSKLKSAAANRVRFFRSLEGGLKSGWISNPTGISSY